MRDPRHYINQIQANLKKIQSQRAVSPADSALFEMVDGLAGLSLVLMERLTRVEQQLGLAPARRERKPKRPVRREERMAAPNPPPRPQPGEASVRRGERREVTVVGARPKPQPAGSRSR
jgi:hypothetical protein